MVMVMKDSETCDLHFVSAPTRISSTITLTTIAHSLSLKPDNFYGIFAYFTKNKMKEISGMFWS
jgi:hypothetical protein